MRIISQNGAVDVPYELTAIHRCDKFIKMNMVGDTGKGSVLAVYSTEAKAIKAMEMLRETYIHTEDFNGGYDMNDCYVSPQKWVLPKVFRFPKDEDVEVEDEM